MDGIVTFKKQLVTYYLYVGLAAVTYYSLVIYVIGSAKSSMLAYFTQLHTNSCKIVIAVKS